MNPTAIQSGFIDPVHQSQQVFRQVLDAMARPGRVHALQQLPQAVPGLSRAAAAVCLTLADFETPLWLDRAALAAREYLAFHCGSPVADDPRDATFALLGDASALGDLNDFNPGSDENPETSTTLILEVTELNEGGGPTLAGPGIQGQLSLGITGVPGHFWQQLADNHALFPRGIDLVLTCDDRIAALPRSTRIVAEA